MGFPESVVHDPNYFKVPRFKEWCGLGEDAQQFFSVAGEIDAHAVEVEKLHGDAQKDRALALEGLEGDTFDDTVHKFHYHRVKDYGTLHDAYKDAAANHRSIGAVLDTFDRKMKELYDEATQKYDTVFNDYNKINDPRAFMIML